jgi:hypothetical protein
MKLATILLAYFAAIQGISLLEIGNKLTREKASLDAIKAISAPISCDEIYALEHIDGRIWVCYSGTTWTVGDRKLK